MSQEPEYIMDKQRDTMVILRFMLFERQRKDRSESNLNRGPSKGKESKILAMLNWIAACFVTEPVNDVVATAVSAEQGRIIVYIATNRGRSRDQDRENGETFKKLLRETIAQSDHKSIVQQLMKVVSPIIYHRLVRKVSLITGIDKAESPKSLVQDRFDAIVDRWVDSGNVEDDAGFLSHSAKAKYGFPPPSTDRNQRLKDIFGRIVSTADTSAKDSHPVDDETRQSRVTIFTTEATTLLKSKFFKSFDPGLESKNPIRHPDKDIIWILRLRRRLWHVACYLTQLGNFARSGLLFIKKNLGEDGVRKFADGGPGVEIVWVGDESGVLPNNHGRAVEMNLSPMGCLNKLFDKFDYMAEGEKKVPAIPPDTLTDIRRFWAIPGSIKPFLHCELQMIIYLEAKNIRIQDNAIGCSKLMCWACNAYMEKVNKERGGNAWVLSGTSEKPHYAWLIPSGVLGDAVVSDIMKRLECLVSRFAIEFGRHRKQLSGGSDSATGSDDDEDLETLSAMELVQVAPLSSHPWQETLRNRYVQNQIMFRSPYKARGV